MPNGEDWITERIIKAHSLHTMVTDAVTDRIKELLNGGFSEGSRTPTQLNQESIRLLSDMALTTPNVEAKP